MKPSRRDLLRAARAGATVGLALAGGARAAGAAPTDNRTGPAGVSPADGRAGASGSPSSDSRGGSAAGAPASDAARFEWAPVRPDPPMAFPRDFGAHPDHRTEWWYVTGWLQRPGAPDCGVQLTFFRSRTAHPAANPSRFAPTGLVLAHAALALPERGRLLHAERAARAGNRLAGADERDTRVWIGAGPQAWRLEREATTDRYRSVIATREFGFELDFDPGGPPLLQGDAGYSRKGPAPGQASRYYSRPQLAVSGRVRVGDSRIAVTGSAWFDHEWSSEILDERAAGWDWIGLNLDDGGALMAFRIRGRDGRDVWRDATLREGPDGPVRTRLAPTFTPLRQWRSVRSGASWPVQMRVSVAGRDLELRPLFDDQELDARGSTGITYWEGAVTAHEGGRRIGRGYLELTGYAGALRL